MTATMDKLSAAMTAQEDMFKLSPLPSTLHCPAELPPDSDDPSLDNDEPLKKASGLCEAYSRQSIPAISVKSFDPPSSGSLLSRRIREHDIMASSLPHDREYDGIFMGKRHASPPRASSSMLQHGPSDPFDVNGDVIMASASLPRQSLLRESRSSSSELFQEEHSNYDRWRRELRDLLQDDDAPSLSRRGSCARTSSPPRFAGESVGASFLSRARTNGGRERSNSDERAPPSTFQFTVSHPPSPPPYAMGATSPISPTSATVSPTSPPASHLIPRPSLISRASSAAREAETRARAAAGERHRRESGGSTTSLSSTASSSSNRPTSGLREQQQPSETLSRRGSLANNRSRSYAIGVQALS
ncbi:hypothetical protein OE88DRAFT_240977 [Heliocybe sulcata]|uniref:Uncharacterized protein n=1 Tax=Heliocybe sulcata TaxID=5364 RepID=A0A5C3N1P6_9AGAM|nr:hypothetical protein OE88DRAFT_240977 [Heliocybe sulcata]